MALTSSSTDASRAAHVLADRDEIADSARRLRPAGYDKLLAGLFGRRSMCGVLGAVSLAGIPVTFATTAIFCRRGVLQQCTPSETRFR